nr:MAG TPA: hypothetical protein [Caudoviricetes sp.]
MLFISVTYTLLCCPFPYIGVIFRFNYSTWC